MLGDVAGMDVVGKLVAAQVDIITRASLSPLGRKAAREAATEAVTGSYVSAASPHHPWPMQIRSLPATPVTC